MAVGRARDPDRRGREPDDDLLLGVRDGFGAFEYARVRDESDKSEEAGPREAKRIHSIQHPVQPGACSLVLRKA
jgi:hypothetical protein